MKQSFHNTINLNGSSLDRAEDKARTQEERELAFFISHSGGLFTPFDVWGKVFLLHEPITSVRRAMTNLERSGYLEKTDIMKPGNYGKPNFCWRLAQPKTKHVQRELWG